MQAAELLESKGELFSDEPAPTSAQTDLFGATPKAVARLERLIWPPRVSSFDSLEFEPVGADEHSVVVRARYCSGSGSAEMTQIDTARKANRRYLLGKGILVDLAHDSIASLALLPCDSDQDGVRLSRIDFLQFRESGVALKIVGSNRFSKDLRMLLEIRPHKPWSAPRGFLSQLREYQERGVEWMLFLQENGFGGLLCDEMGLGKTHQALALIASLRESSPAGKGASLVVCPSSVMGHWEQLASRFAPELSTAIYHGGKRDLDTLLGNNIALLITSYGILRNDSAELWSRRWNAAIFDEIQQCKTRSTEVFKAAQGCSAGVRLGLTGTPVENSLSDIKSLFDIVLPGYLGSDTDFVDRFLRPIEDGQSVAAKSRFRRMIGPFILRRLKKGVARELPEKIEDTRICQLGPQQQRLYKNLHQKEGVGLISQLRDREQPVPYMHILGLLVKMKQLCDHPRLIDPSCDSADCPKFELLCELIDESLESGEKVVVFSQFLDMIDLIAAYLAEKTIGHVVLTGATTNRTALINRFAADPECKVFVASLLAGGTGIDLSAASVVIHYDRWWTAAREDQATDRVHRIGQTRGVQVFKFITSATIEERIELIINRKRTLANDALTIDSPDGIKTFTREDLLELLEIGKDYTGN